MTEKASNKEIYAKTQWAADRVAEGASRGIDNLDMISAQLINISWTLAQIAMRLPEAKDD